MVLPNQVWQINFVSACMVWLFGHETHVTINLRSTYQHFLFAAMESLVLSGHDKVCGSYNFDFIWLIRAQQHFGPIIIVLWNECGRLHALQVLKSNEDDEPTLILEFQFDPPIFFELFWSSNSCMGFNLVLIFHLVFRV